LKNTINKRVKEISLLQIDNLKLEEDNKQMSLVLDEILNDPKTSPEISYSVNRFINNGFSKTNSFFNSNNSGMTGIAENKEKTMVEDNLSQVFSSRLTNKQYIKLKDVFKLYLLI